MPGGVLPQKTPSQRKALRDAIQQPGVPTWEDLLIGVGAVGAPILGGIAGAGGAAAEGATAAEGSAAAGAGKSAASGAAGGAASGAARLGVKAAAGGAALGFLADTGLWTRVLEAVGGVLLLVIALRALLGGDSPASIVTSAVRRHV